MQIQGVGVNNSYKVSPKSNITFGYNPVVNAELIRTLENTKRNKAFYNYIKEMVYATNDAEKELRDAERKKKKNLFGLLALAFVPAKILLTNLIDTLYPDLKYREKELESYAEEAKSNNLMVENPDHWINELTITLSEQEAQEQAEIAANILTRVLSEKFPKVKLDQSSLTDVLKQKYINEAMDEDEEEDYEDEQINQTVVEKTTPKDLKANIELGKSKVDEYVPTPMSEQGFASLGGMKELKEILNDRIVGVLKDPVQAKLDNVEYGKKIPKGLLLYGPPGTGKTTVVEHLSTEAGVPLLKLKTGKLKTSYWHETSKNIDAAFDYAEFIATPEKPVLMMIDDADSFFVARSGRTEQFQAEELTTFLDRIQNAANHNVMVVATTNKYDVMDDAVRSRFDEQIYVGLPDLEARTSILKMLLNQRTKGKPLAENDEELGKVANKLESFAIREIISITNRAAMRALKDGRRDITYADYEKIISESQNLKVKEENYKTNATRKSIGFSSPNTTVGGPNTIG